MLTRRANFSEVTGHLRHLLRSDNHNPVREMFLAYFHEEMLATPQRTFLAHYLSSSAKDYAYQDKVRFWWLFTDYSRKRPRHLGTISPDEIEKQGLDAVLFTRWNSENFREIFCTLGVPPLSRLPVPALGAEDDAFEHPQQLFDYLQQRVIPALHQAIMQDTGQGLEAQQEFLADLEEFYADADNLTGIEILRPFPVQNWRALAMHMQKPAFTLAG